MNAQHHVRHLLSAAAFSWLLVGCSAAPKQPEGADTVRNKLTQLQSDPQLATRAPVAIKEAEVAVRAAEQPSQDLALGQHLVLMADRKVETARARAQTRLTEDERKALSEQRETARLDSRTREADRAHRDVSALQREIAELNAKETERGLVVTLGDLLFETGRSELKGNATNNLQTLVAFLNRYPERSVTIEGHTDSVGSREANFDLSQRRADAVRFYLQNQGIASNRLMTAGKGEETPIASNSSASGRQLNRRVEIIIANSPVTVGH